jgi:hypothetical protein
MIITASDTLRRANSKIAKISYVNNTLNTDEPDSEPADLRQQIFFPFKNTFLCDRHELTESIFALRADYDPIFCMHCPGRAMKYRFG